MRLRLSALALALCATAFVRADEGMWTFDNIPAKKMKDTYGFAPDQAWLDHVRLASVRFPGGSGSFVSRDGLVLTNHHVAHNAIEQVSDKDHDYVKQGFVAVDRGKEIPVPGLVLLTLESMTNVTDQVEAAVKAGMDEKTADKARTAAMDGLLKEARTKSGLQCEAVVLYQGGQRWIYGYRRHTDVRLVMAPEYQVAAFGMDWDNFSFPRHDLDFTLFRVYQDGKPYVPPHHLAWTKDGLKHGDMTFTSGHPGRTSRLMTRAQMLFDRDLTLPLQDRQLKRDQAAARAFAAKGEEHARLVSGRLQYDGNFIKVFEGQIKGLKDPFTLNALEKAEAAFQKSVAADPALAKQAGGSWKKIEAALQTRRAIVKPLISANALSGARGSSHLSTAIIAVRLATEAAKPEAQRLPELVSEEALKAARGRIMGFKPKEVDLEKVLLEAALQGVLDELGPKDPLSVAIFGGDSPKQLTDKLFGQTNLQDEKVRGALVEGGLKAVSESKDPFIALARRMDPILRSLRKQSEASQAIISDHSTRLAKARFKVYGTANYPDATFSLRLSYGAVATYEASGTLVQPFTTFGGLYDRADAWGPKAENGSWSLPARWQEKRGALNLSTPYNFVSTNDIIGGNSGSPVIDRKGELVGLAFDGNIESLPGSHAYDGRVNRMIGVDARAILEVLDKVFDAKHLADELRGN